MNFTEIGAQPAIAGQPCDVTPHTALVYTKFYTQKRHNYSLVPGLLAAQ